MSAANKKTDQKDELTELKELTEPKDKELTLIDAFRNGYGYGQLDFGMVRKVDDSTIELVIGFKPCRDYLHDVIRCQLHGEQDWYSGYDGKKCKHADLDRFRLVLATSADKKQRVLASLTAINLLESSMGITDKMRATPVKTSEKNCIVLLEGDPFWFSDPHLMSIISLVTRWIILRADSVPENLGGMTIDDLLVWFKTGAKSDSTSDSKYYMPSFIKRAQLILKHHREIFRLPFEEAYPPFSRFSRNDYHSKGGIHELCNYSSGMDELESVMKKLEGEVGVKD